MSTIKGVDCIAHQRCLLRGGGGEGEGEGMRNLKKAPQIQICATTFLIAVSNTRNKTQ